MAGFMTGRGCFGDAHRDAAHDRLGADLAGQLFEPVFCGVYFLYGLSETTALVHGDRPARGRVVYFMAKAVASPSSGAGQVDVMRASISLCPLGLKETFLIPSHRPV